MNAFILHLDPALAAEAHADCHVVKMVLETVQILSTGARLLDPTADAPYRSTHVNHPVVRWAAGSLGNFRWLVFLLHHLTREYRHRYGREHASWRAWCASPLQRMWGCLPFPRRDRTPFAQAMPEGYRIPGDPVAAYRAYYLGEKRHLLKYTRRQPPGWVRKVLP